MLVFCKHKLYYFFQVVVWKRRIIGSSSSLPASISKMSMSLDGAEKNAKFPLGPTSESPGPILFIAATTDVKVVTISCPSKDSANTEAVRMTM